MSAKVLWLTGLSGAGKSTISNHVVEQLTSQGKKVRLLDGDQIRASLPGHIKLGYGKEDAITNSKLVAELCRDELDQYDYIIVAVMSPYKVSREYSRSIIGEHFAECFVDAPVSVCIDRDTKGLYQKALSGEITNLVGVQQPYEAPHAPEVHLETHKETPLESAQKILDFLHSQ